MVTGVVPHVGGPILPPGCPKVLVGALPAARVGDMLTCVGPPDVIAMGSTTVWIGNMMAARMGDMTAHGGSIVVGLPTVMIGDSGGGAAAPGGGGSGGGIKWALQPGATAWDLAQAMVLWNLAKTRRLPDGNKPATVMAMEALERSAKTTTINVGPNGNDEHAQNAANGMDPTKGSDAIINFNPNKRGAMSDGTPRDPESSFAHEAYHGYQDVSGTTPPTRQEQEVAAATAENEHRAAKGLNQRQKYGGTWDIPQYNPPATTP
jgi:uncharacterized Zn-binding protein involved in type VI secretion